MSLFNILLSALRPDDSVWRRKKLKNGERIRVIAYRWLLKHGMKAYRNLAVYDAVSAAGGRIKVIHEYRDLAFEDMLKAAKVAEPLKYKASLCPFETRVSERKHGWKWFNFTDTLVVQIDGQNVNFEHGELYKVTSSAEVTAKRTSLQDGIDATYLTMAVSLAKSSAKQKHASAKSPVSAKTASAANVPVASKPSSVKPKNPQGSGKPTVKPGLMGVDGRGMFGKNPLPTMSLPQAADIPEPVETAPKPAKEPPVIIRKGGVEIDTSF